MKECDIPDSVFESIIAYFDNELTKEQADDLISWLTSDNQNLKVFNDYCQIWHASGIATKKQFNDAAAYSKVLGYIKENGKRKIPGKILHLRLSSVFRYSAAAVAILVIAGSLLLLPAKNKPGQTPAGYLEAQAPKGSRTIITLPDGSTVWLNSDTKIKYNTSFGSTDRELLLNGEAYFEVAHNKDLPFRVKTSEIIVTALGTSFNVKAYDDEKVIETTLEKGEVRIDNLGKGGKAAGTVFLKPNQKAVYNREADVISLAEKEIHEKDRINRAELRARKVPIIIDTLVDTRLSTSWKDSKWIFKSENLRKLKPILERRFDITVVFRDSSLSSYKFTGTIKEESLDQVLDALSISGPIKYTRKDKLVTLYEDPEKITKFRKTN